MSATHTAAIIIVAFLTIISMVFFLDGSLSWVWIRALGAAVSVVLSGVTIFDRLLWRLPLLQGWFVERPCIAGVWKLDITSHSSQEDQKIREAGELHIKQTFSSLTVNFVIGQTCGAWEANHISKRVDGKFVVYAVYRSESLKDVRDHTQIHYGALMLKIEGPPHAPTMLDGHYWNEWGVTGDMVAIPSTSRPLFGMRARFLTFLKGRKRHIKVAQGGGT